MERKIVWLGLIIVLSMSTLFGTLWSTGLVTPGSYGTWGVDDIPDIVVPIHYETIQDAIDAAGEGATIFVRNGRYPEHITIDKPLKIEGESKENTTIDCYGIPGSRQVVFINSSDVTVCNFTIKDPDYYPYYGIQIGEDWKPCIKNIRISGNKIRQCARGIEIKNASDIYITDNEFEENTPCSISSSGFYPSIEVINNNMTLEEKCEDSVGIEITRSNNSYFFHNKIVNIDEGICTKEDSWSRYVDNEISGSVDGILIKIGQNNTIVGNQIEYTTLGISIEMRSSNNTVTENKIAGNSRGTGIKISSGGNNTIARNNVTTAQSGVDVYSSNNNSIEDNFIYSCGQACKLTSSSFNDIIDNIICSSDCGIHTDMFSANNSIYHNDFHKNNVQAIEEGNNQWDNGPDEGGNYWSDYVGIDSNSDGIGDAPHYADQYPLVTPRSPIPVVYTVFHAHAPYEEEIRCGCRVVAGNMTISSFGFNKTTKSIVFNVTVSSETCCCNITVPKQLLRGAFEVYVDDIAVPCMVAPDQNCCNIYLYSTCFEFSEQSTYNIGIMAEAAIPLTGDVNNDGFVDIYDVVTVSAAYGDKS